MFHHGAQVYERIGLLVQQFEELQDFVQSGDDVDEEDDHVTTLTSTTIDDQIGTSESGTSIPGAA